MGFGGEYHINLYRHDETLSVVMVFYARADADAEDQAERMLVHGLVRAEIWRDDIRIAAIDARTGPPTVAPDQWTPHLWRIDF